RVGHLDVVHDRRAAVERGAIGIGERRALRYTRRGRRGAPGRGRLAVASPGFGLGFRPGLGLGLPLGSLFLAHAYKGLAPHVMPAAILAKNHGKTQGPTDILAYPECGRMRICFVVNNVRTQKPTYTTLHL